MPKKIIVTGAAGFIGSCLVGKLNELGYENLILVDDFSSNFKKPNWINKHYALCVPREDFLSWAHEFSDDLEVVFHLGARTDTTEMNEKVFDVLNLNYSKQIFDFCSQYQIPLLYASSAATYGGGELGYSDDHHLIPFLQPLNPYGISKNEFDKWVLQQKTAPPFWAGFKFFNVYGPNEYHKNRMASVVFHSVNQIRNTGKVRLFRSHRPDYADGMQKRDFIYVFDVVETLIRFWKNRPVSGIYNLGTGKAEPFLRLAEAVFEALELPPAIEFMDTPIDIRDKYQYFTQADIHKLEATGLAPNFTSLHDGIIDYVGRFLKDQKYY
jgi:ADP-L-glycero-D-manno-heptose 6-epimerase